MSRGRRLLGHPAVLVTAALVAGIALGRLGDRRGDEAGPGPGAAARDETAVEAWTCSMHPHLRLPGPGHCPICFMDLIPAPGALPGDPAGPPRLEMSQAARALAEIRTAPVVRDRPRVELRLVGKVDYDETRVASITARVDGRLDRLLVDFTGRRVQAGDPMAEIYSPGLVSAQEELLQALRTRSETEAAASPRLLAAAEATVAAAREKLHLLGITTEQVAALETGGAPSDHVTLHAPSGGVVIEKGAVEGDYVGTGTVIYRIAALDRVWVQLDAYESDLAWLRVGQEVTFAAEALPGRELHGRVSFVAPTLDPRTRTVKVRVDADNRDGLLKPEMFVRATVLAQVGAGGELLEPGARAGTARQAAPAPLVVPRTAVLLTGKRAIVYVEVPGAANPTYEGREVVLGPRAGEVYVVESGLAEGERVVVNGSFKIDSALQIQARPSMMAPSVEGASAAAGDPPFAPRLAPVYEGYFRAVRSLAADDAESARAALRAAAEAIPGAGPDGAGVEWGRLSGELADAIAAATATAGPEPLRARFERVSGAVVAMEAAFGHVGGPYYVFHCPMAFGDGADWLQDHATVDNPYFGSRMLRCGSVRETRPAIAGSE
jgi:Cu(I)/Ag(I) efflux system membrane fusion protein